MLAKRGKVHEVNEGILVFSLDTISTSLACTQSDNQVFGCYISTCSLISSLRPLMKNYLKKKSCMSLVHIGNCSKAAIKSIIMLIWNNFVSHPK